MQSVNIISAEEVVALGTKRRWDQLEVQVRQKENFDVCYGKCIQNLNEKLVELGKDNQTEYEFSFWNLLGNSYCDHMNQLHDKLVKNLKNAGFNVAYPIWSDSMEADGTIIISWTIKNMNNQ